MNPSPGATRFARQEGVLHVGAWPVPALVARHGSPLFIYDGALIRSRFQGLQEALAPLQPHLHYSVKACSNLAILELLRECGAGFDVVSGGELERCLAAGVPAAEVVFAGVGKTPEELTRALQVGIGLFNVESVAELRLLERLARQQQVRASVALRLNPDVDAATHRHITTGRRHNKFGITRSQALEAARNLSRDAVDLAGVHMHIGSQIAQPGPYLAAARHGLEFLDQLRAQGWAPRVLNLGGGFGVVYDPDADQELDLGELAAGLGPLLAGRPESLYLEPGRTLVAPAGLLVMRVLHVKQTADRWVVVTDAGMNDFLRPALYEARHQVVDVDESLVRPAAPVVDVVGPICESADFFARNEARACPQEGDLLAVLGTGAYGFSMSSNYNTRPRAPEVLVEDDQARLIRRRETVEDLLRPEREARQQPTAVWGEETPDQDVGARDT